MQVLIIKLVVGDGFEPSKSATADLQTAVLHSFFNFFIREISLNFNFDVIF